VEIAAMNIPVVTGVSSPKSQIPPENPSAALAGTVARYT